MSEIRVCHVGFNFFPGQGLTVFYEFARHQARQGVDVSVIAPGRPDEPEFEIVEGVQVNRVLLNSIGRFSLDRAHFLAKASRILRNQEYDLIHVYAFVGAGLLRLSNRKLKARWLYDCQTAAIKPPLLALQNSLIRIESYGYESVTALSEGIRDRVFGTKRRVDAIVPLGADFDHFAPRSAGVELQRKFTIAPSDVVLCYCGTLDHNRRMEKLIDAFALVAARFSHAKLLVLGDGSALSELKQQARDLGLTQRIIFAGFIPYKAIPDHLALADIALAFISMDACFEYQPPTKTVEYLAQGLPVIATNTSGNRSFVSHGVNGILCNDTPAAFGQAIIDLLQSPHQIGRLAAHARVSVTAFNWESIVREKVIPHYRRLLT